MKRLLALGLAVAVIAAVGLMVGCEDPFHDSSTGGSPAGTATVQGNVSDFGVAAGVAAGVKAGVTVMLKGTSYKATTAEDGTFVISGVPAGNYILVLKYGNTEVEYPLGDVADNSRVEIKNITVSAAGSVSMDSIKIVDLGSNTTRTTVQDDDEPEATGGSMKVNVVRGT